MNLRKQAGLLFTLLLVAVAMTVPASAGSYSGVAYCGVSTSVSQNAPTSANLSAAEATGTECATFSASAIAFSAEVGGYSLGGFLTSYGAASGITYLNGFSSASNPNDSLWVFTGTASFTNGESFTVTHDDGTEMYVNGLNVLNAPFPTAPVSTPFTYSGPTGNFNFQFIYTECCGGQMDYLTTLAPPTVPEPSSLLLFGSGLVALGVSVRRRFGW